MHTIQHTVSILGCGWVGLPLALALREAGYRVKGATTTPAKLAHLQSQGVAAFLLQLTPEVVGEAAFFEADTLVLALPPGAVGVAQYAEAVGHAAAAARAGGVRRVIFCSSTSVYGDAAGEVDETTAVQPETASARAIVAAEQWLSQAWPEGSVLLRLAGLSGPGRQPGRWLAGKTDLAGGHHPVNLVHLHDVVGALCSLLAHPQAKGCYNLCAPLHPTRQQFYPAQALALGLAPPTFAAAAGPPTKVVQGQRVVQELGYVYQYPDPAQFIY